VYSANGGWNINWMEFTTSQPPSGAPIPGMIESENFSDKYGVDVENTSDVSGSKNVGYVETGDWMDYAVSVSAAGTYTVNLRIASPYTNQQLQFKNSSGAVLTTVSIPQTGAYITWRTISATVTLPAGNQTLRVYSANGGWNINWMQFISGSTTSNASLTQISGLVTSGENITDKPSFSLFPNPVIDRVTLQLANTHLGAIEIAITNQSGTLIKTFKFVKDQNTSKLNLPLSELAPGIYFIKVKIGNWTESKKLIKM
jgi:endoglucanase